MTYAQAIAQGAKCGHLEGQGRAGQYVIGEEELLSWEAAYAQTLPDPHTYQFWAAGYRLGYLLAAEGSPLPTQYEEV